MNKILSVLAVFFLSIASSFGEDIYECTKLYMKPNSNWKKDNAWFAVYFCNGTNVASQWVKMKDTDEDGIFEAEVEGGPHKNVIFCRMNPAKTALDRDSKWNQTADLEYDGKKNQYDISDWNNGNWNNTAKTYNYFITGNGVNNNPWCNGVAWTPGYCDNKLVNNQISFTNLPAGNYEFKITNGSWATTYAYSSNFDEANSTPKSDYISYINTNDDNIKITTTECSDITVKFNPSAKKKISVQATIHEPKYVLMGIGGKWDTGVELTLNPDKTDELMLLDQKISKANDAIKIVKKTPCGDEFFADIKVVSPVPYNYGDNGNIVLEDGTYDFYFDKTTNQIYISGYVDNAKIVHLDPKVENGYDWEADDARFAVYYYNSANDKEYGWVSAKACNGYYYAYIPAAFDSYVWCRMNPNNLENRWNTSDSEENKPVWNQTSSISYDENNTLTKLTDMNKSSYQIPYNGICGENYENLNCTFPEAKDTVYVHINQFVESDPCNYIFRSFEQAFAVLKTNTDICTSSKVTLGSLKEDQITFTKPVVMLVHFGSAYYRGNEKVGMSGGDISNAPAIFFRNINQNGGQPLIVRTAEPKGNRAVLVHPVIRRSTNIVFDNLDIIGDENQKDNALDIDTGEGRHNLEGLGDDFNVVPLSNTDYNITIKNCFLESFGRNCMHVVGINGIHVENNEFYTKYDFSQASHDEAEDVVDWGGTVKMINSSNIKFLRNNSEGTLATSFFIQGCQRVLLMNNVFWNDNSVVVTDLSAHGRTVANIRLVTVNDTEGKFPLQNIGIYYNTFFIRDNNKADESYKRFDFFRLGGAEEKLKVTTTNADNFNPNTIRFQYNNCYSYDDDIIGNNDDETNTTTFYLQGIGKSTEWCQSFKYNNFWSRYDANEGKTSSTFEIGKFCVNENETYNLFEDVSEHVCSTDPTNPGALVVKGDGLNIGTVIEEDVSLQGADEIFNDRLNPDNGINSVRPVNAVDNSNESLTPYDKIYKEPGTINLYTSPIVGSQTTDVHISSLSLTSNSKVNLSLVDAEGNPYPSEPVRFAITDVTGTQNVESLTTDENGSLDSKPVFITFVRPEGVEEDTTYEVFLKVIPENADDSHLILLIPIRGHYVAEITKIGGAWTVGAFQQRQAMPVNTIIWHGSASTEWDNRNNWYKEDGTLVTCLDALTEDLTVIIPNKDSEKYITPPEGITQYPQLPEISNDTNFKGRGETWKGEQVNAGDNATATEVAHKIFMEYGAALVGVEQLGANRYSEAEVEFTARRKDWLLVGSVVKPWELDENGEQVLDEYNKPKTRDFVSGDYYLNHLPHVYMHEARIDTESGDVVVNWNETFAPLDVVVDPQKVFAVRLPNQYGPKKFPASVYNKRTEGANYDGDKPHTYSYKGRFYNETDIPRYTNLEQGKPTLLTNTYPANIDADELAGKGDAEGTFLIYDYEQESFVPVGNRTDAVILSQHGFVFTPANNQLTIENKYFLNNETGHRSLTDDILSLRLRVKNEKASVSSEVYISYDEFKEDKMDYAVDAPKVFNGMVPALPDVYVMRYDKNWAGLTLPDITKPIPLGVRVSAANQVFKFTLVDSNLPFDIILEDRQEEKTYNLSAGETCEVSDLVVGKCEGRFYLNLSERTTEELPEGGEDVTTEVQESDIENSGIDIYTEGNKIVVSSTSDVELQTIMISDISGRHQVYNVSGRYVTIDLPVSTGVYTIYAIGDKASRIEKLKLN